MKKILFLAGLSASLFALNFDNFDDEFDRFMNGKKSTQVQQKNEVKEQKIENNLQKNATLQNEKFHKTIYKKAQYNNFFHIKNVESPVQFDYEFDALGNLKSLKFFITLEEKNSGHYLDYQKYYEEAAYKNFVALSKIIKQNELDLQEFKSELKDVQEPSTAFARLKNQLSLLSDALEPFYSNTYKKIIIQNLKELNDEKLLISFEIKEEILEQIQRKTPSDRVEK